MAVRNGLDLYSIQADMNARRGQESINVEATPPDAEEVLAAVAPGAHGSRLAFAGLGTLLFAGFFFGMAYMLGSMTGESLFRKVAEEVI